jgi:hypothetical protein
MYQIDSSSEDIAIRKKKKKKEEKEVTEMISFI